MMNVDCETCPVQGLRCEDCVITALFVPGSFELPLDAAESSAVAAFVRAGLVSVEASAGLRARREPWEPISAVG
ncbi:MAG: hypothetical protein ABI899_04100 [Actinomycetota bacterium]